LSICKLTSYVAHAWKVQGMQLQEDLSNGSWDKRQKSTPSYN